jgi:NADH-quinone oxidoreductase subunit I
MTSQAPSSPVAEYFGTVWNSLKTTLVGLGVTGRYLLRKPVTLQYPDEKPEIPEGFRGIHVYEVDKCIACDLCAVACPVDCIYIESIGKGKIDYNRCMFCALCIEPCPADCIHMGKSFDLSRYTSESCSVEFVELSRKNMQSPTGESVKWAKGEGDGGRAADTPGT